MPETVCSSSRSLPPRRKSSSAIITLAPALPAASAAVNPDGPAPAINKSQCKKPLSYLSGSSNFDKLPNPALDRIMGS